jgi:hypothetical protein
MSKIILCELQIKNDSIVDLSHDLDSIERVYGGFLFNFSSRNETTINTTTANNIVTINGPADGITIQQVIGKI